MDGMLMGEGMLRELLREYPTVLRLAALGDKEPLARWQEMFEAIKGNARPAEDTAKS